jgi:hypothetical protein
MVKKTRKGDIVTIFWYTLKNLHPTKFGECLCIISENPLEHPSLHSTSARTMSMPTPKGIEP